MSFSMFVGNAPPTIDETALAAHFAQFSHMVTSVRLVRDRITGKARYGFVDFSSEQGLLAAVRLLDKSEIGGRQLRLEVAKPDGVVQGSGGVLQGGSMFQGTSGVARGGGGGTRSNCSTVDGAGDTETSRSSAMDEADLREHINTLTQPQLWEIVNQTQALVEQAHARSSPLTLKYGQGPTARTPGEDLGDLHLNCISAAPPLHLSLRLRVHLLQDEDQARALLIANPSLAMGVRQRFTAHDSPTNPSRPQLTNQPQ